MTADFSNHKLSPQTLLTRIGSNPARFDGALSPPAQRASTLVIQRSEDCYASDCKTYGLEGMAAQDALGQALRTVEQAQHCFLVPSGLFACVLPILALGGGHVLVADNVYRPTRRFCQRTLRRLGGSVDYFDPATPEQINSLIRPDTSLIFLENPGSLTMEICDTPAIVAIAQQHRIPTVFDNTWSAGLLHRPLDLGVDIVVQATTKYQAGHSDVISGAVLCNDASVAQRLDQTHRDMGVGIAAEDAWLVLRGLRTLAARIKHAERSALEIGRWLASHPCVSDVIHPALPECQHHRLWKRDFSGATGLFTFCLHACSDSEVHAFLNSLCVFRLGFSWGGYESLAIWCDPQLTDRCYQHSWPGPLIRLSIGLEDASDLIADLDAALARFA